jgi:hypothetical protein
MIWPTTPIGETAPLRGGHAAPRAAVKGLAGGADGPVDVFGVPLGHVGEVSPVAGFGVSNVLPDAASVHCPSMNSFRGAAVNSSTLLSTVTVMNNLISFSLGSHNETTTVSPSQGDASKGDTQDAAGEII